MDIRVLMVLEVLAIANAFPESGKKNNHQVDLTVSSFRAEDYGPAKSSQVAPSLGQRIQSDEPATKDTKLRPKCVKSDHSTYCLKAENYPTDYINDLVNKGIIKNAGFVDVLDDFNLTQRVDVTNEIPLCLASETLIEPQEGETESGDWFFIANTDKIKQGVRVEECIRAGETCSLIRSELQTKCEQKYIYREMIGLNGAKAEPMKFKIPSCCMCTILNAGRGKRRPKHRSNKRDTKQAKQSVDADTILFPQMPLIGGRSSFAPAVGACANGSSYCTKVSSYPTEHIRMLIKMNAFKNNVGLEEVDPPVSLATRFSSDETMLCNYRVEKVAPEAARTKDKSWEYIVQFGEEEFFTQTLRLEICADEDKECNFADKFPGGYKTTCKQKYVYRQLASLDPESGKPKMSHFQLPSCCVCNVQSMNLAARFGVADPAPMTPIKHRK